MRRLRFLVLASLLLPLVATAAAPDLDALISYDTRIVGNDGLTKTSHFQEHLIRRAEQIWAERLLPKGVQAPDPNSSVNALGQREDFDYGSASRYISLNAKHELVLDCIDPARVMVVHIPANSFNLVGFADTWESSGALVEPKGLAAMQKTSRHSPVADAVWYQEIKGLRYVRILWSPKLHIALRIESGTSDGFESRTTTVQPQKTLTAAAKLPWLGLDKLIQHDYEDFSD